MSECFMSECFMNGLWIVGGVLLVVFIIIGATWLGLNNQEKRRKESEY